MTQLNYFNIQIGQMVELHCEYLKDIFRFNNGILTGKVISLFWIDDSAFQVEIANKESRFRWDSKRDGGYLCEVKANEGRKAS